MSAPAAASAYWRIAGMSYLKYSNLCGDMVRSAMKDGPAKVAAKQREVVYYRSSVWEEGAPTKQGPIRSLPLTQIFFAVFPTHQTNSPTRPIRRLTILSSPSPPPLSPFLLLMDRPAVVTDMTENLADK